MCESSFSLVQLFLRKMRLPRKSRCNGVLVSTHNPSAFLSLLVNTASSKTCLTSDLCHMVERESTHTNVENEEGEDEGVNNVCHRVGPNIHVAMAAAHFKLHHSHPTRKKEIRYGFDQLAPVINL